MVGTSGTGEVRRPAFSFRAYRPSDIPAFARMAKETWPAGPAVGSEAMALYGMEGYMVHSLRLANWTDVACGPEGVLGFLLGRIDGYRGEDGPRRPLMGELPTVVRSYLGHGHMVPALLRFLWSLILTDLKLKVLMPRAGASIEMFIVDPAHRGMGVGSSLLERFLEAAEKAGSERVVLYTDDASSNWQFYDRRGFMRVGTFRDNITSHYSGLDARGIVYVMDLAGRSGGAGRPPRTP
jgi:ribosomal protein S18 acetylase RimI-like enzyme